MTEAGSMQDEGTTRSGIVDAFSRLVEAHCPRGEGAEQIGCEDGGLWEALFSGGWLDVGGAADLGGSDLPLPDLALLAVEWGRRLPPLPFSTSVLARRWGLEAATGTDRKVSFALPAEHGVIVPFGQLSDVMIDAAISEAARSAEPDAFSPALPVVRVAGQSTLSIRQLSEIQVMVAAEAIGAAQQTFDRAIAYSQERIAYGSPISGFQAMRHWMADMHRDLELAKTALFWALNVEGAERRRALVVCVDLGQGVAAAAIQVFGGIGFTWDFGAHLHLRHTIAANEIVNLVARAA